MLPLDGPLPDPLNPGSHGTVQPILDAGKKAFLDALKMPNYTRMDYNASNTIQWNSDTTAVQTCAKIFLGCLPLMFNNLSHLYWKCHASGGGWNAMTLGGSNGRDLSYFMYGMAYDPHMNLDRSKNGSHIVGSAFSGFTEFSTAMTQASQQGSVSPPPPTNCAYATFTQKLREEVKNAGQVPSTCPLSALFYGASSYFRYQQITSAKSAGGTPKTIREMLYFLAALQFSPQYDAFDRYVTSHFQTITGSQSSNNDSELKLQVADSGITPKPGSSSADTLSAADLKSYLASTFHLAPAFIGLLQGSSTSGDPWLHSLFSNSQLDLSIPSSGTALFSKVSNYAYALQFQLTFLYSMCGNIGVKCGWQECRYGKDITGSGDSLQSHICPGFKCQESNFNHKKGDTQCNHNDYGQNDYCGKGSNGSPSPLQAFITGALPSFGLSSSSTPNHMSDHPQGALCHTPMGFEGTHLRQDPGTGNYILSALRPICGEVSSPFRQLSEKLGCLTKRTPRTLGDLFGFTWHLNGQLFNTELLKSALQTSLSSPSTQSIKALLTDSLRPPTDSLLSKTLNTLESGFTFWGTLDGYFSASALAVGLYGLNRHCHKKAQDDKITHNTGGCTTSPNDMWSLLQPVRSNTNNPDCMSGTCGGYLSPLTHSAGATYAPVHASVYLSWLAYLTDDFHDWFQSLLDEFKNIDCSKTGCRTFSSNTKCDKAHSPGTHGDTSQCSCDSVVHCGGVLPVLYRHGFQFYSPYTLSGGSKGDDNSKRSCDKFHSALSNVLAEGAPLAKLLESIDEFLYAIRWEFFSKLSGFWTIYVCIILYTFFFLLDTLHVRSHLHFPSSNSIAPISLLGTGKAPALKKFTKLTYFMP
ncbi:variant erythrocyte surface antigen-1 family protein [Babesia caballi]|uniref:Variant erythrocyte surface antigen-1 family protein n=1 Tax=Babesia caballi TaxID=5871 RepID=A0AAV4LXP7_BABCB|nr:variant erythrocyte surface antigen-1 family protein [Babesia caballi]